ncbi:hypothetical protein FRC01_014458, partial [Tulasnella sp. 417]
MNSQSTFSRTPHGALQTLGIYDRFTNAKTAIIDLIKNTAWTSNSLEAQQSLLQTISGMADIPENAAQLSDDEKPALEAYIATLEQVRRRLEEASAKYGKENEGKRDKFKHSWAHLDRSGGIQILNASQTDIKAAINRFLNRHEERASDVHVVSTQNVPSSTQDSQVNDKSSLSDKLAIAKTTFDVVETVSGTIPLIGTYIGTAAKLGSSMVEMWQCMDSNKEAAKSLEARMAALAEHLEYFKSQPQENQNEQTNKRIKNLQLQL